MVCVMNVAHAMKWPAMDFRCEYFQAWGRGLKETYKIDFLSLGNLQHQDDILSNIFMQVTLYEGWENNLYMLTQCYALQRCLQSLTLSVSASSAGVTIGFLVDGSGIFMIAIQLLVINFDRFM